MIKNLISCLFLSFPITLIAQTQPSIVGYFNETWKKVQEKEKAMYYRTVENYPGGLYLVKDYYMSGKAQMQPVICSEYTPKLIWEGSTILYHENGTIKEEGFFKDEERYKLHKFWYDNGNQHKTVWCEEDKILKYHQYWSKSGETLLINGTGIIEERLDNGNTYFMDIQDSVSIGSFLYDETLSDTVYLMVEKIPEYNGGLNKMYQKISANMSYPKSARRAGTEGTVFIGFIINEDGKSISHTIIKGISNDCDQEALRVVKLLNEWSPGKHRGKPVKVKFVLPINYRLD